MRHGLKRYKKCLCIKKNMFTDKTFDTVSFNSQLSTPKSERSANIQTTEIVYDENETQTVQTRNVETQTVYEEKQKPPVDYDKLAEFMKRVTPSVIEALDEAYGTNAFDDYDPESNDNLTASTELLHKVCTTKDCNAQMKVSGISWSTGGGTLAVSHGISYHESWCDHLSKILLYDHTKEGSFSEDASKSLETNACVMALSYHPTEPSILAAGLFSGDVLVWNLRDNSSITPLVVCTHEDAVSQILWKARSLNDVPLIISSSKDGYILMHKLVANFTTVRPYKRFKIAKEHNPAERSRPRSAGGRQERTVESGLCVTAFDFSSKDSMLFVVGTLCGGIYKCSTDRIAPIEGDETLIDPVIDQYERHEGSITSVKCTPLRNLFVTASTVKEIRIYDFEQHASLQSIPMERTVIGLTWMIGNQDVFATYGAGPDINLFSVTDGKAVTNIRFERTGRENISSLHVNSKRDLLALGDTQGNVEIWKVPRQLLL